MTCQRKALFNPVSHRSAAPAESARLLQGQTQAGRVLTLTNDTAGAYQQNRRQMQKAQQHGSFLHRLLICHPV